MNVLWDPGKGPSDGVQKIKIATDIAACKETGYSQDIEYNQDHKEVTPATSSPFNIISFPLLKSLSML